MQRYTARGAAAIYRCEQRVWVDGSGWTDATDSLRRRS